MSEDNGTSKLTAKDLQEAPASATIRCSYMDFDILFTIRGFSRNRLWDDVMKTVEVIYRSGAQPIFGRNGPLPAKAEAKAPEAPKKEHWCEEHNCAFEKREKDGRVWYSHAIEGTDPTEWCNESKKK